VLTTPIALAVIVVVALAALIQGYAGFGFGITAVSLFALLPLPIERMTLVITCCAIAVTAAIAVVSHRVGGIDWRRVGLLLVGSMLGMPLGYVFICRFGDRPAFRLALGVTLVAFGLGELLRPGKARRLPAVAGLPVGVLAGFLSGAFTAPGPPVVLYLFSQVDDPRRMKATIQAFFFSSSLWRLAVVGVGIGYSADILALAGIGILAVLPALVVGHRLSRHGSPARFRRMAGGFLILFGAGLALRALA
jgi:uncharacterized membrane protein YfcA